MIGGQAASAKQALVRVRSCRNWRYSKPPASRPAAARPYHSAGGGVLPASPSTAPMPTLANKATQPPLLAWKP